MKDKPKQIEILDGQFRKALQEVWTVERVKQFCIPKNRLIPYTQSLVLSNCEYVLCGKLHEDKPELGKISWYALVKRGQPDSWQIDVVRKGKRWRGCFYGSDLLPVKESPFVKRANRIPF